MRTTGILGIALAFVCGSLPAADYVIVTTDALASGFADLAEFRSSPDGGGYSVATLTVEAIHAARRETTAEARIRAAIRDTLASEGERYVVLGARAADIPPVRVWTPIEGVANNWTKNHGTPSDWYYACLDREWTATETGVYGYSDFAALDLTPEANVGRIPAACARDVRDYVRRLRRYSASRSGAALHADRVLLHGLALGNAPADFQAMGETCDGYPWIGETGHPAGAVDSELWLRNIARSRILSIRPDARFDLYFPGACSDPESSGVFTDDISIDNPAQLQRYLSVRPELLLLSSHGLPAGVGRVTPLTGAVPGNAWSIAYSTGCNTAQFDTLSLANAGAATGMAPPDCGAFDGTWREYSLAEHLVPGCGEHGGLVYIASTREGFRVDGAGGIGAYSYAMMADFAEHWARGGETLGAMFTAHKNAVRDRALAASDWRSLFVGVTYFGDPALRPLRDCRRDAVPFRLRFATGATTLEREVWPGQTLAEAAPVAGRAGAVLTGWRSDGGRLLSAASLLDSSLAGTTLAAEYRAAGDRELLPPENSDPALARTSFDNCAGEVALKGRSLSPASKTAPVQMRLPATEAARYLTVFLRHESGFENDEDRGVALAIVAGGHRLEFRRRLDLGYTVCRDGEASGAFGVPPGVFLLLAVRLSAAGVEVSLDGRSVAAVAGDWSGEAEVYFGGASAAGGYAWANAGTLYLDEAVAFAADGQWTVSDFHTLQSAHPGAVPLRRTIPSDGVWSVPAGASEMAVYALEGAGKIAPDAGAVVPEILLSGAIELAYPADGPCYLSPSGLQQFGLDAILWPSAAAAGHPDCFAVTEPRLLVDAISVLADGRLELAARIEAAGAEGFAPVAVLHGRDPFSGVELPPDTSHINGSEARLFFPSVAPATTRLLRLELGSRSQTEVAK